MPMHKKREHISPGLCLAWMAVSTWMGFLLGAWMFLPGDALGRVLWTCEKPFAANWESAGKAADEVHHAIVRNTKKARTAEVALIAELRELPDGR